MAPEQRMDFLKPLGLTQADPATRMRMTTNSLNEITQGERGVTPQC